MSLVEAFSRSYREFQRSWTRLADSAFGGDAPAIQDEMSRSEFTSAFLDSREMITPPPRRPAVLPKG